MNVFLKPEIADNYDAYYQTDFGKQIDQIEKRTISGLLQDIPRAEMLEVGCGTGHWSAFFTEQQFKLTATDISDAMLKYALGKEISARFIKANAQNLPFEAESFNIVSTITMLEFVDDQDKVLQEIYRVLKPQGWFLIGGLNANSILAKNKDQDETFKDAKFLTEKELRNKLKLFGTAQIEKCVYLSPDFNLLDGTPEETKTEPVFMAAIVQKTH